MPKFRDPIHGFIYATDLETKIIDSAPFQRLRNIKQLAMSNLVYHGAEHTRFGHSLGVMHLVDRAFKAVLSNYKEQTGQDLFDEKKALFYCQILRLIGLTHDIGHAPFSHASESVFPEGMSHEDFSERIIKETEVAGCINEIGKSFKDKYGDEYNITPELICNIYSGKEAGENSEYIFLKSFMDGELDCDKMDYLLRDSYYCGVEYGKYDLNRLISCLTAYKMDKCIPVLAVTNGGIQVIEAFILARYFMFIEVYFHKTRRFMDLMFTDALKEVLPDSHYPEGVSEYLKWDDCKVWSLMKEKAERNEACRRIIAREHLTEILGTKTHPKSGDKHLYTLLKNQLFTKFGKEHFIEDDKAIKMPHKLPKISEEDEEKAIFVWHPKTEKRSTISSESNILQSLTENINLKRLYVKPDIKDQALEYIKEQNRKMREEED